MNKYNKNINLTAKMLKKKTYILEDWGSKEDLWEQSVNILINNLSISEYMDYDTVHRLVLDSLERSYETKLPLEQIYDLAKNFSKSICLKLNIKLDPVNEHFSNVDHAYVMKDTEHRILYHYIGKGNKGLVISAQSKKSCNTSTDIRVWGNNIPMTYTEKPVNIKVCRRKRDKKNTHGFRIELTDDGSNISGNNNPNYETTYIAFVVENPAIVDEMNIYVHSLKQILDTVYNLQQSGERWDQYRNELKWYRKHNGIFLTNQYIKDKSIYVDRFHFDPRDELI